MSAPPQIVILGASGDLMQRKLAPALAHLASEGHAFTALGVARRPMESEGFRRRLCDALPAEERAPFASLAPRLFYRAGDVTDPDFSRELASCLDALPGGRESGRLFYVALAPGLFVKTVEALARGGLLAAREGEEKAWRRVVMEKPFGWDLESARTLNETLHRWLFEEQIYRIDHYLGKETVQNLLGFRFHNAIFEPLWSRQQVESVAISVAESAGVDPRRARTYDQTGALRDVVQNHMLQILALVAMEPPTGLDPQAVRDQKVAVLRGLRHPADEQGRACSVRARYGPGAIDGTPVPGYAQEEGVRPERGAETWVALRASLCTWRWSGVPFLLRHGKRMPQRFTEVRVRFRAPPLELFDRGDERPAASCEPAPPGPAAARDATRPNELVLCIQPREGIRLSFGVKKPGPAMRMDPATLAFDYRSHFGRGPRDAYERLLLDALRGDPTLFLRADEIEASWRYVDAVRRSWEAPGAPPLREYPAGSWGPAEADALFAGCEGAWSHG